MKIVNNGECEYHFVNDAKHMAVTWSLGETTKDLTDNLGNIYYNARVQVKIGPPFITFCTIDEFDKNNVVLLKPVLDYDQAVMLQKEFPITMEYLAKQIVKERWKDIE